MANDPRLAGQLAIALRAVSESPGYRAWAGSLAEAVPFQLAGFVDAELLERTGIACDGHLTVKLTSMGHHLFLTDGVWVDPRVRVFPFSDESSALTGFVRRHNLDNWADSIVDLATGCGHTPVALGVNGVAFDINTRALAFAIVNRALNGVPAGSCLLALNDIRNGIPETIGRGLRGNVLVLANMPFGPSPSRDALPLTSHGGESGIDLQIATYRAIADLAHGHADRISVRACILGLTVGNRTENRWEIVDKAIDCFGIGRVGWNLLNDEHVFRIDGVRQMGNPAPVADALRGLASCRLYTPDDHERAAKMEAFDALGRRHAARGNPDIAYGIVEIS